MSLREKLPLSTLFLVVDDLPNMRTITREHLGKMGFVNVLEAKDGDDALGILKTNPVNFMISGWVMPRMTGFQLLKQVRSIARYKDTPFVMVTAEDQAEKVVAALRAGVSGYVIKPFSITSLESSLIEALARSIS